MKKVKKSKSKLTYMRKHRGQYSIEYDQGYAFLGFRNGCMLASFDRRGARVIRDLLDDLLKEIDRE